MPTRQQVHIDRALTNISVAYMQDANNFIADKVFPTIPVQKQSDTYFIYDRAAFFRDEAAERAKGTESAGGDYDIQSADPYYARKYAFHQDVYEEDRVNADNPLQPNQDATDFVTNKLLLKREVQWASKYFTPGVWGKEWQGVSAGPTAVQQLQWNQSASSPISTITGERTGMMERTGFAANTLVLSPYVYNSLKNHPDILDRIKYTQKGIVTLDLLATLFDVDNVYVPQGVQNTANKGAAESNAFIMGKHALLCYVEKNPGLKKPSAGYIFAWTGLEGAGAYGNRVVRIPMPTLGIGTERVEGEMAFDMRLVGTDLGTFFKDIVA